MSEQVWVLESPVQMVETEVIAYSIDWLGASSVAVSTVNVYRNGIDVTSSVMISGDSNAVSGNVLTMKKITAVDGHGGSKYVVVAKCTVDNNTEIRKVEIEILTDTAER